jgi:MAP/microtubule affinity-regulating kinase
VSKGEDFDSNRNFGEYEIIKLLGEGGFGSVSLAKNKITGDYAAIKVIKANKSSSSRCIDMLFK